MADLNYDRMVSCNADGDRGTTLQIGVYMGLASITVFSNKAIAAKFPLQRAVLVKVREILSQVLAGKPSERGSLQFHKYDFETKKQNPLGSLFIGRDDKALIYLGVQVPNHPHMKFLLRSPLGFDTAEPMSELHRSELAARTVIEQLQYDFPIAILNTSFKREMPNQRSGGAASGGRGGDENIFG